MLVPLLGPVGSLRVASVPSAYITNFLLRESSMLVCNTLKSLREARAELSGTVALVPTMGYLHEGHLSLVRLASEKADHVIVSIFVNPIQFNNQDDLARYPRDLDRDIELLEQCGQKVALVFAPTLYDMYPPGFQTSVEVSGLTGVLEGVHRPGHFKGVTTVVTLLFNMVQPQYAVFGEKDFQQLRVIEQMVADLRMSVEIVRAPLMREKDGLAMSSRNVNLSPEAREASLKLSAALNEALDLFRSGERGVAELKRVVHERLEGDPLIQVEYVEIADGVTLESIVSAKEHDRLLIAAFVGGVRLIDNISLENIPGV